jgi:hypothetical protein
MTLKMCQIMMTQRNPGCPRELQLAAPEADNGTVV